MKRVDTSQKETDDDYDRVDVGHDTSLRLLGVDNERQAPQKDTRLCVPDKPVRFGNRQDH